MSFSSALSLSHLPHPSEQLCYVHCNICITVLAVTFPCTILFKTVTVRCGHCTNHLPVNMRGGLLLPSANQFHLAHSPEKRQRVPSAYNRFIKDETQRIRAENPDITHREAFGTVAKNWAHFRHSHFGLMPDQTAKNTNEGEDILMKDGFFAPANVGVSPY